MRILISVLTLNVFLCSGKLLRAEPRCLSYVVHLGGKVQGHAELLMELHICCRVSSVRLWTPCHRRGSQCFHRKNQFSVVGDKPVWCCQEPRHKSKCADKRDLLPQILFAVMKTFLPNPGKPDLVGVFWWCLEEGGFGALSEVMAFRNLNILWYVGS